MDWVTAAVGVGGILLGGGLKAAQTWWERRLEARAVLNTLVAEVDTIRRLVNGRGYIRALVEYGNACRALVADGRGAEQVSAITIPVEGDYFRAFDALIGKIGMLDPYEADRIIRFYMLMKAVKENVAPSSPWAKGTHSAQEYLAVVENDVELLRVGFLIAGQIGTFVDRKPTKHIDPLIGGPEEPIDHQLHVEIDTRFAPGVVVPIVSRGEENDPT